MSDSAGEELTIESAREDRSFFDLVPLEMERNLAYRIAVRKRCTHDLMFRAATQIASKKDILYWLSTWVWIYEPRPTWNRRGEKNPPVIPFIPWEHQIPVIRGIEKSLGFEDIAVEKSRGEGMSWISVLFGLWDWLYDPMSKIGLVSRNKDAADSPDDPDSLMWKITWELTQLPIWMVGRKDVDWKRNIDNSTLLNMRNGSSIASYAATANVGRGGRYKWFMMDELGSFKRGDDEDAVMSTQHSTNSRLFVSTPAGSEGAYYRIVSTPGACKLLSMHWSQNPTRNRGLYRISNGKLVAVDPVNNPLPPNYEEESREMLTRLRTKGFNLEKGVRSPWYDLQCDRSGATPQRIAQELDLDYAGSQYLVFGDEFYRNAKQTVRPPVIRGAFTLHPETNELIFERTWDGAALLWTELDHRGKPPDSPYVVSADIGAGLGGSYTSNSVIQVLNMKTREQVLEFATSTTEPSEFADICVGVAKWFHGAYLAWEINGPGAGFGRRVLDRQYGHLYRRTVLWKSSRKKTKEVGWHTNDKSKPVMFAELLRSVLQREIVIRSEELVKECRQYVYKGGVINHQLSLTTQDDSSKGQAHGDRVIALGVGIQAAKDRPDLEFRAELVEEDLDKMMEDPPMGTMAWRMRQAEEEERRRSGIADDGWDARTNGELANPAFS